jgi:hypothetical protein
VRLRCGRKRAGRRRTPMPGPLRPNQRAPLAVLMQTAAGQRVSYIDADLFQFFDPPMAAIAAKTQTGLFLDVGHRCATKWPCPHAIKSAAPNRDKTKLPLFLEMDAGPNGCSANSLPRTYLPILTQPICVARLF